MMDDAELRQRIMEVLEYDPETGLFRWKEMSRGRKVNGWFEGSRNIYGYPRISVFYRLYLAHHLAWLISYGELPGEIDHENQVRSDNRLDNLRKVTHSQNQKNMSLRKSNKSGFSGVCFDKRRDKWHARINVNSKQIHLGFFIDIADAIAARQEANIKYGYHPNHGRKK